jgi:protein-glutamine gamma-glutamyltransferase
MSRQELGRAGPWLPIAALFAAAALNIHHLAWWSVPLLVLAAALHLRAVLRGHALPGRMARIGLTVIITAGVLLSFRTLNGLTAGATLLVAMSAAKLFEARSRRDWYVICGAALFLLLAACLDRQQLWRLPLYALCLWLITAALRGLAGGAAVPVPTLLREALRQLAFAVPLAIVCFLFFPRLPGVFWAVPSDADAITGLGEEMSPGNIARLVESEEPALRARFAGPLPPATERYWRGPVLHDFDGFTWRRHRFGPAADAAAAAGGSVEYLGPAYHYSLTLEPNTHRTVIALELARPPAAPYLAFTGDFQLISSRPLTQAQGYELTAYPHAQRLAELPAAARQLDLALPTRRNPRARELALRLRAQAPSDGAFVASVMNYLRTGGFEYTLAPQRLGRNSVDELLFDTRQGFCGHYASAFVDLMRAAGVPARVVTGYQGGEWNPIGGYLVVRQADAHAWAEVWLAGRGWLRADPTAMVAPERLDRERLQFGAGFGARANAVLGAGRWLTTLLQGWDAANAWWQDEVIGFNFTRQLRIADWLGFGDRDWQTLAIALGAGMSAWLAWIAFSLRRLAALARPDALTRAWRRIDRRLARAGQARAAHEGVLAYCERLALTQPALAARLAPLARRYAQLRFGPAPNPLELREFLRAARRFALR